MSDTMSGSKFREFWIDEGVNGFDLDWVKRWVAEFPRKGTTEQAHVIHVIEHSAYLTAIEALKKIAEDFGTDYCDGNCMLAHETLEELGEV